MKHSYKIVLEPDSDGCYHASIPALKGCFAFGDTPRAALAALLEVKTIWLEHARDRGWRIPESEVFPLEIS